MLALFPPMSLMGLSVLYKILWLETGSHARNFKGSSITFRFLLDTQVVWSSIFWYVFLGLYAYKVSWMQAVVLFGLSVFIPTAYAIVAARLRLSSDTLSLFGSLLGMIALPILAWQMWDYL